MAVKPLEWALSSGRWAQALSALYLQVRAPATGGARAERAPHATARRTKPQRRSLVAFGPLTPRLRRR